MFFTANVANAQHQNVIKINPLSLAAANINLSYERFLSEKASVQLQSSYWIGTSRPSMIINIGSQAMRSLRSFVSTFLIMKGHKGSI